MRADLIAELIAARSNGQAAATLTDLASGHVAIWSEKDGWRGDFIPTPAQQSQARRRCRQLKSGRLAEDPQFFLHISAPPARLFIIGAVHIAQTLAPLAQLCGFRVTLVDPRRAFATSERFPEVAISSLWPDEFFAKHPLTSASAVATLTHDPKIDDPALCCALKSPAFYIGALGSTGTHAKRCTRLRAAGISEDDLRRIQAPIGLALGSNRPEDIAAGCLAEIIAWRHQDPQARAALSLAPSVSS